MNSKQTTLAPPTSRHVNRFGTNRSVPAPSCDAVTTRAASILLGLELRGRLTNREKDYLDSLAPDNGITFLVRGDSYLHPAEIELFPADVTEAAVSQGGDAYFSHHFEDRTGSGQTCRVYTGLIGEYDGTPLVLGMFGPDDPINRELLGDRFGFVLGSFRTAFTAARKIFEVLPNVPARASRLIVNRASGRVTHVDRALCDHLDIDPAQVVSREFGEVTPMVSRLVSDHQLKLENVAGDYLHLAVMTFVPLSGKTVRGETVNNSLVDTMRDDLAAITSSAGYIEDTATDLEVHEITDLAAGIVDVGERLDRRLARHQLLDDFDRRESIEVNVVYQLEQAIDRLTALGNRGLSLMIETGQTDLVRTAPADAWLLLFESVLETHRISRGREGNTTVRISRDLETGATSISFTTVLPAGMSLADLERSWYQDTESLAARLAVTVNKNLMLESNTIVTRLTLSPQKGTVA